MLTIIIGDVTIVFCPVRPVAFLCDSIDLFSAFVITTMMMMMTVMITTTCNSTLQQHVLYTQLLSTRCQACEFMRCIWFLCVFLAAFTMIVIRDPLPSKSWNTSILWNWWTCSGIGDENQMCYRIIFGQANVCVQDFFEFSNAFQTRGHPYRCINDTATVVFELYTLLFVL